jgi:hypothetical protein
MNKSSLIVLVLVIFAGCLAGVVLYFSKIIQKPIDGGNILVGEQNLDGYKTLSEKSGCPISATKPIQNLEEFAKCLGDKGVAMYGTYWCPHCQNEKKVFGDYFKYVNYVECTERAKECINAGVSSYPTWIIP